MALNYEYAFVEIDPDTNMCIGVYTGTTPPSEPNFVLVPVYDEGYGFKYYNWDDGKFYYDAEYTQEYISPLI